MIYELALAAKPDAGDDKLANLKTTVSEAITVDGGEVLLTDDWGAMSFAQATAKGLKKGNFIYFIYKTGKSTTNTELARRFKINEYIVKTLIVKMGEDDAAEELVKKYKTPFSKTHRGSQLDDVDGNAFEVDKDRRHFARKKSCWFTAKKISVDWKDPNTYAWLTNEFGKISPARISGISRKHQRFANTAIKRARQIGLISHLSSSTASNS